MKKLINIFDLFCTFIPIYDYVEKIKDKTNGQAEIAHLKNYLKKEMKNIWDIKHILKIRNFEA